MSVRLELRLRCDWCGKSTLGTTDSMEVDIPLPWLALSPGQLNEFAAQTQTQWRAFCSLNHAQRWADEHKSDALTSVEVLAPGGTTS